MNRRSASWALAGIALLTACSSPTLPPQLGLRGRIESGSALNTSNGRYRVGAVHIALTKIVSLPGEQLGLRFVISAPTVRGRCCSLFPRVAMAGQRDAPSGPSGYVMDVAEDPLSIAPDGSIAVRLFGGDPEHLLGTFRLDLPSLGVGR
jgi:hypothetical protein